MLFLKELKNICFSFVYVLFLGILVFGWYRTFCGVTQKEIAASKSSESAGNIELTGGGILNKPVENDTGYGMKNEEVPDKIMQGGIDMLILEYEKNSYAAYPFTYYKEVVLSDEKQEKILDIIKEITGLTKAQIDSLPKDYFPSVNGNIIHFSDDEEGNQSGSFAIEAEKTEAIDYKGDYTKHFIPQVTYERFQELMAEAEEVIGRGSYYSMDNLRMYYGLSEMTYEEALEEYEKTIYEDRVTAAFARLFCDYLGRGLGLYPAFAAAVFWLRDRKSRIKELVDSRQIGTVKLVLARYLGLLTAILLPVVLLSFESLLPLMAYSADTGISIDVFAFINYILWWLLPTVMIVTSLGMFVTILTSTPLAVVLQFLWWFADSCATGLYGDTKLYTLMIRHNILNKAEVIREDFTVICLNRGLLAGLSLALLGLSVLMYHKKRGERANGENRLFKYLGIFKKRFGADL